MNSDKLLSIPGEVATLWAQHDLLVKMSGQLQDCSHCVRTLWPGQWTGWAADLAVERRNDLIRLILRGADAAEDAADAVARFAITLAEVQSRRKLLALAVADNTVSVESANEDVIRWREQADTASLESSAKVNAAKHDLDTISSTFKGLPPAGPPNPAQLPGPGGRLPDTTDHRIASRRDSSPYAAERDRQAYNQRMPELIAAVSDGTDVVVLNRGTYTWQDWQQREGREIGRVAV